MGLMGKCVSFLPLLGIMATCNAVEFCLPTPNAFPQSEARYLQPVNSDKKYSAGFGMVREDGRRYHGGIDIQPIYRDDNGEPADSVFAITDGHVTYVSADESLSNYGKYVIIEHDRLSIPIQTLYAHLSAIDGELHVGDRVSGGQAIGTMGYSSNEGNIPRERAHLHFELGLRLGTEENFQRWYNSNYDADDPNPHGMWSGLNRVAFDPMPLLRNGFAVDMAQHVASLPTAFITRIFTQNIPEFLLHYPALCDGTADGQKLCGYDIEWTWNGIPKGWRPHFSQNFSPKNPILIFWDQRQVTVAINRGTLCQNAKNEVRLGVRTLDTLEKILGKR